MDKQNIIKTAISTAGTGATYFLGSWDSALQILILFMVLDYITGFLKGYVNKELSSDVGLKGIARKTVIFIVLIVAVALDRLTNTGTWVFRTLVCYFYIANEGLSLIENCASLGLPIPRQLKNALIQLKEKSEKDVNENENSH